MLLILLSACLPAEVDGTSLLLDTGCDPAASVDACSDGAVLR